MKRLYFSLLLIASIVSVWGQTFEVDGIYYSILSTTQKTVSIKYADPSCVSITIPPKVTYNGDIYSVVRTDVNAFNGLSRLKEVIIEDGDDDLYIYYQYHPGNDFGSNYLTAFHGCPLEKLYLGRME